MRAWIKYHLRGFRISKWLMDRVSHKMFISIRCSGNHERWWKKILKIFKGESEAINQLLHFINDLTLTYKLKPILFDVVGLPVWSIFIKSLLSLCCCWLLFSLSPATGKIVYLWNDDWIENVCNNEKKITIFAFTLNNLQPKYWVFHKLLWPHPVLRSSML